MPRPFRPARMLMPRPFRLRRTAHCDTRAHATRATRAPVPRVPRCDFWIHAECDGISDAGFHFLTAKAEKQTYYCPGCRGEAPGVFG
eukprot:6272965-Prymnesium_polylepis.1